MNGAKSHPLQSYIAHFYSVEQIQGKELFMAKNQAAEACVLCRDEMLVGKSKLNHFSLACKLLKNFNPEPDTTYNFLALGDATTSFSKPCIIDIKMGRRQYGYGASQSKIRSKELKTRQSTSRNLFFRCASTAVSFSTGSAHSSPL